MSMPLELRVEEVGRTLEVAWRGGRRDRMAAARLRAACRCADCTRARADGRAPPVDAAVAIRGVDPVGGYGVNLTFSDGHKRGIYPWAFLRELAEADHVSGVITCSTAAADAGSVPPVASRRNDA